MSDFSSEVFLQGKSYWTFLPSSTKPIQTAPFIYHLIGILFTSITNGGVIRLSTENSILILEHDTFNSITSNQNGGCILLYPGHSIYQKNICARIVYSSTKVNYGYININQTSENINYNFMISLTDSTTTPTVYNMLWLGGGKTSLSNYNSTNNTFRKHPGFILKIQLEKLLHHL